MIELIAAIVLEGMKVFRDERKYRIRTKYWKILKKMRDVSAEVPPKYTDVELDELRDELMDFLKVYQGEIKEHNEEANNS